MRKKSPYRVEASSTASSQQRPERAAEPLMGGNIEADFSSSKGSRAAAFPASGSRRSTFCRRAPHAQIVRQCCGELHDPMIEKRRPHLDGMRHADAVDFGEDIVRKIILLIEPEIGTQVDRPRPPGRRGWNRARAATPAAPGIVFRCRRKFRSNRRERAPAASGSLRESASVCSRSRFSHLKRATAERRSPPIPGLATASGGRCGQGCWPGTSDIQRTVRRRLHR